MGDEFWIRFLLRHVIAVLKLSEGTLSYITIEFPRLCYFKLVYFHKDKYTLIILDKTWFMLIS